MKHTLRTMIMDLHWEDMLPSNIVKRSFTSTSGYGSSFIKKNHPNKK